VCLHQDRTKRQTKTRKFSNSDSSLGFLGDAFLLTGLEVSFKQKNRKVTSVPVDIGWLA
jgi:hypothetical protein